jgi:hypothetical protein
MTINFVLWLALYFFLIKQLAILEYDRILDNFAYGISSGWCDCNFRWCNVTIAFIILWNHTLELKKLRQKFCQMFFLTVCQNKPLCDYHEFFFSLMNTHQTQMQIVSLFCFFFIFYLVGLFFKLPGGQYTKFSKRNSQIGRYV